MASALAKLGWFYTTLESGDIKFIMRGETLHRTIYDLPQGKDILCVNKKTGFKKSRFNKRFGLYWIGFPPFGRIHHFSIVKERENPEGKTANEWIRRDEEESPVNSLRSMFPRPFLLKEVELKDRVPIDLLVIAKFEVVDPYIPVFIFKGRFSENASGIIRSAVIDALKDKTLDEFIKAEKDEVSGILQHMKELENDPDPEKGKFNRELIKQVGLRLVGISVPQYDPHDDSGELRRAMNAKTIAKEKAEGLVAEAEGYEKKRAIEAQADKNYEIQLAEGRRARVLATREALAGDDATAKVLQAEALPNLTTLVEGDGRAKIVVTTGGNK
jgi:regulator of protease activity HflC (stomatin/prohibitin superfamily)